MSALPRHDVAISSSWLITLTGCVNHCLKQCHTAPCPQSDLHRQAYGKILSLWQDTHHGSSIMRASFLGGLVAGQPPPFHSFNRIKFNTSWIHWLLHVWTWTHSSCPQSSCSPSNSHADRFVCVQTKKKRVMEKNLPSKCMERSWIRHSTYYQ